MQSLHLWKKKIFLNFLKNYKFNLFIESSLYLKKNIIAM